MAIWTPTSKTFPVNIKIIPSAKKWVFYAIICLTFLSLYSEHICSLNRLVLTVEEDAEYYCSFECLIGTHDPFRLSKVMLCTFHQFDNLSRRMYIICYPQTRHSRANLLSLLKLGNHGVSNYFLLMQTRPLQHKIYELIYDLIYIDNFSLATYL
jgi:hypothetical protein